jgi:phosphoheptose isomerase
LIRRGYVLLDRDGTVVVEKNYLSDPDDLELTPGAGEGLRLLYENGFGLILVTNQSGIGRGYFNLDRLNRIHDRLRHLLQDEHVTLDAIYYCPHTPKDECACRKPKPQMAFDAARDFGFDPGSAWVVGDKPADVELARNSGAKSILVRTGYGLKYEASGLKADYIANDISEAARFIMTQSGIHPIELPRTAEQRLRTHIAASIATKEAVLKECEADILDSAQMVARALAGGCKLLLCGNGGSAADCQHLAAEFVSVLTQQFVRPGLPAIALTTDSSILTASANDFGFEGIFRRQVQALGAPGDVLIGISTSGTSRNVVCALEYARAQGIHTIAFTGRGGGRMAELCDITVRVPSGITQFVQESHIMVGHILCDLVEQSLLESGVIKAGSY